MYYRLNRAKGHAIIIKIRSLFPARVVPVRLLNGDCDTIMHVEFFGVPRERAGISELEVQADTLGQLLGALAAQLPAMGELIAGDRLHPSFVASLNGDAFVSDPGTRLGERDRVLILSADAGG